MASFRSTWRDLLPEDEIGRQQAVKERLCPGVRVLLNFDGIELGEFIYSGLWDTMHCFYPASDGYINGGLTDILPEGRHRYIKRDIRGRKYLSLPYTLLADIVTQILLRNDP